MFVFSDGSKKGSLRGRYRKGGRHGSMIDSIRANHRGGRVVVTERVLKIEREIALGRISDCLLLFMRMSQFINPE